MRERTLLGLLMTALLAGSFANPSHAQADRTRAECDRLIKALEGRSPAGAHDALQKMRVHRQGNQYQACIDTAQAEQGLSSGQADLQARELAGTDVFNEENEQVGNVDRLARGSDQRIYVLMTYRGPRWPGNKQVAVPLEQMTLQADRLMLPGIGEDDILAMPAVPHDGGAYESLRGNETVNVQRVAEPPTETGNIQRQP